MHVNYNFKLGITVPIFSNFSSHICKLDVNNLAISFVL